MGLLGKLFGSSAPRLETPDDDPQAKRLRAAQQKNDWKRRPPFFDAWVDASPNCSEAWLLRGAHGIQWAWEARSGASAQNVAEEAWPIFFERLKGAWSDLNHAIELNPADPTPFGQLIPCAMACNWIRKLSSAASGIRLSALSFHGRLILQHCGTCARNGMALTKKCLISRARSATPRRKVAECTP